MKFDLGGETYEFDTAQLSIGEARDVKRHLGVSLFQLDLDLRVWSQGVGMPEADTLAAVVWIALRRAGRDPDLATVEAVDVGILGASIVAHEQAEAEPGEGSATAVV